MWQHVLMQARRQLLLAQASGQLGQGFDLWLQQHRKQAFIMGRLVNHHGMRT